MENKAPVYSNHFLVDFFNRSHKVFLLKKNRVVSIQKNHNTSTYRKLGISKRGLQGGFRTIRFSVRPSQLAPSGYFLNGEVFWVALLVFLLS